MDSPILSSPERLGRQATYKDRKKRKRTVSHQSDSESSIESRRDVPPTKSEDDQVSNGSPKGKLKNASSPTRSPHDTKELAKPKVKKARHTRNRSVTFKEVDREMAVTPAKKRQDSVFNPRSKASIGDDEDDNVSIAESTISIGRVRRNEAERIQYFENQPECGKMEPHHVQCLRCDKSVNLGRRQTYAVRPWEIHRASCDQRPANKSLTMPEGKEVLKDAMQIESPSAQLPTPQPTSARRPSEQQRKEFLESDNQTETVEKHRVSCRKCLTWIDLGRASSYATGNWVKHKVRCSAALPSSRVAAAKRRLLLVNDSQAVSFDSRNVGCALCGAHIALEGEGDFDLTMWNEHKAGCIKPVPVSKIDSANSIQFPGHSPPHPPLSSASTEDTLIVDFGLSSTRHSLKRPREETDIPVDDMPKIVRPRSQSYLPPTAEPPDSIFGWFMLPFHSFVRGFKESLMERS